MTKRKNTGLQFRVFCLWIVSAAVVLSSITASASQKPRLLILTDIGGDPDDEQAMVRLMAHACEFDIEGLITSAAGTPGELKEEITKPYLIAAIVEAYGKVQANLRVHNPDYPTVESLRGKIKTGNPKRGWGQVGEGKDTEGSKWIVAEVDQYEYDPRPLNIAIWGGQTDLAQALWRVQNDRGPEGLKKFMSRFRVYDIGDQDGIFDKMREQFPGMFYILAQSAPGKDKRESVYRGMYLGGDESLTSLEWLDTHVRSNHGPLGALYPPKTWTTPNPHGALKEGDTPSWFYYLPNGLSDPAHPEWGAWGGRFEVAGDGVYRDATDRVGEETHARATVWRWREAFQNEFQARMDWCVADSFDKANHPPRPCLGGDESLALMKIEVPAGQPFKMNAKGSSDPDGNELTCRWFDYPEAGIYGKPVEIKDASSEECAVTVPADAAGKTLHVILQVTDQGTPPLTRYRRAVLTIVGNSDSKQ